MAILAAAGDAFQKTSVDEAYLELSSLGSFDAAVERARGPGKDGAVEESNRGPLQFEDRPTSRIACATPELTAGLRTSGGGPQRHLAPAAWATRR